MKRIALLMLLGMGAVICVGCSYTEPPEFSKLLIVNMRSEDIIKISWNGHSFGDQYIWDGSLWKYGVGLEPGNGDTQIVEPGSAPVKFRSTKTDKVYKTDEIVTVKEGKTVKFTLSDSTPVTKI